jgi:hypothetical protein
MSERPGSAAAASVSADEGGERFVFVCERCGRPLAGAADLCLSNQHTNGSEGVGRAIRSSELARLAATARAALGGWR